MSSSHLNNCPSRDPRTLLKMLELAVSNLRRVSVDSEAKSYLYVSFTRYEEWLRYP